MSRRGALVVAHRAARALGIPFRVAAPIAFACRKHRLRYALGFAFIEQESAFQHIFGHDAGGLFPGLPVTKARYRALQEHLRATHGPGANGVGLSQVTYWTFVTENPGLWKKRANAFFGLGIAAELVHRLGERAGAGAYNGGETNPNYAYADEVLAKADAIRPHLAGKEKR